MAACVASARDAAATCGRARSVFAAASLTRQRLGVPLAGELRPSPRFRCDPIEINNYFANYFN